VAPGMQSWLEVVSVSAVVSLELDSLVELVSLLSESLLVVVVVALSPFDSLDPLASDSLATLDDSPRLVLPTSSAPPAESPHAAANRARTLR